MSNELVSCLSRYIAISEDLANILMKSSLVRQYPGGAVLLREGERIRAGYFVLKGCVAAIS